MKITLTYQALEKLFGDASALEMGKESHKICLISRDTLEDVTSLPVVKLITPHAGLPTPYPICGPQIPVPDNCKEI